MTSSAGESFSLSLAVLFMTKLNHRSDLWCPIVPLRLGDLNSLVIIPSSPWRTISHLTSADLPLPLDLCQQRGQSCKYRWKHLMFGALPGFWNAHPGKTQCTRLFLLKLRHFYGSRDFSRAAWLIFKLIIVIFDFIRILPLSHAQIKNVNLHGLFYLI